MHKRAFQALKRTFLHVSGLLPAYFGLKNQFIKELVFLSQNLKGEDLRHA